MCKRRDDAYFIIVGGNLKYAENKASVWITPKSMFGTKADLDIDTQVWFAKDGGNGAMIGPFVLAGVPDYDSSGSGKMRMHLQFRSEVGLYYQDEEARNVKIEKNVSRANRAISLNAIHLLLIFSGHRLRHRDSLLFYAFLFLY